MKTMCEMREAEHGMALVVVLWILAFLGVIFITFTFSMRTELAAASNFREQAESYYIAEAGVYRAAAEIMNADRNVPPDSTAYDALNEHWHTNPGAYQGVPFGQGRYWVTVTDEDGKMPLNGPIAPQYDAMLRRLFSNAGVRDEKLLSTIVDSIQDWRDSDKLHRLSGAEDDFYRSLPVPYRAKNANFDSIDELLLVKGMTPEILYGNVADRERRAELEGQLPWERQFRPGEYLGVARYLSVLGTGFVNVNTAGADVLMALGMTAAETKLVLAQRTETPFHNVANLTNFLLSTSGGTRQGMAIVPAGQPNVGTIQELLTELQRVGRAQSGSFYVESTGRLTGSRLVSRVAAILQNVGTPGRPKLTVRLWNLEPRQGA